MKQRLEADLEEQCRLLVIARNGEFLKFVSPGNKGVHDRLLVLPGFVALVELKRNKRSKVQPLQDYWQDRFTQLGLDAYRVSTLQEFAAVLEIADMRVRYGQRRLSPTEFFYLQGLIRP